MTRMELAELIEGSLGREREVSLAFRVATWRIIIRALRSESRSPRTRRSTPSPYDLSERDRRRSRAEWLRENYEDDLPE